MRNLILGLSLAVALLAGCIIGAAASRIVVPPAKAGTNPPKWQYACLAISYNYPEELTKISNRYGAAGFEMVAVAGSGTGHKDVWCFKRRRP